MILYPHGNRFATILFRWRMRRALKAYEKLGLIELREHGMMVVLTDKGRCFCDALMVGARAGVSIQDAAAGLTGPMESTGTGDHRATTEA